MTRKVEKVFTVAVPISRAWEAFADSHERSQWEAAEYEIDPRPDGIVRWKLPGVEATGRVEEADPPRLLRHTELTGPHAGCEVTVRFEEAGAGTRIVITHSGFGSAGGCLRWGGLLTATWCTGCAVPAATVCRRGVGGCARSIRSHA